MILRGWLVITALILAISFYLVVGVTPPEYQLAPGMKGVEQYRAANFLPSAGAIELSDQIGHEVFDIPEEDGIREAALKDGSMNMAGMNMEGMNMEGMNMDGMNMEGMNMEGMNMEGMNMEGMNMDGMNMEGMNMDGMNMDQMQEHEKEDMETAEDDQHDEDSETTAGAEHTETGSANGDEPVAEQHGEAEEVHEQAASVGGHGGGSDAGITVLAQGTSEEVAMAMQGVKIDRTVNVTMDEWAYNPMSLNVGTGEVVRLLVRHVGSVPHEFMLMDSIGMNVVDYRLDRADWNLLEHEAIYERPIVMPGDAFELVIKVDKPGMYMYMCMFPKHMQFGMMGMLMAGESMM